jgi:hypothetical protein
MCGGGRHDADADVDGVTLVVLAGGGVAEPDMPSDVVGWERDLPVSVEMRHGQAAVPADADDYPAVAVADGLGAVGAEGPIVAAGGDDVADGRGLAVCDADAPAAEFAALTACLLDGGVEGVDVFVRLGDDRDAAPARAVVDPGAGRLGGELLEGAFRDTAVVDVGIERLGIARSQLEGRRLLPTVPEAVDGGQLVAASAAAELVEHAAPADGLELAGVANEDQSPTLGHGEGDELVERTRPRHACFVEDQRGTGWQSVCVGRPPVPPLVEQLGDGVRRHAGLGPQDLGGLGCRRHRKHGPALAAQVLGGATQHCRPARAGRTDDQDEAIVAGHSGGCVCLQNVEAAAVQRR